MAMTHLSIKNVPEPIVEQLRARAKRNHRSLQGELLALVTESVRAAKASADASDVPEPAQVGIEEIAAEHRARWPEAFSEGPSSTEIIRAERDAR